MSLSCPPGIVIRDYRPEDWDAICGIHDRSRPYELRGSFDERAFTPLAQDPESESIRSCQMFVAESSSAVVGFAGIDGSTLAWLYVEPTRFRQGIGRALLQHCLERLGESAWTIACGNNTVALRLYRAAGFSVERRFEGENAGYRGPLVRLARRPEPGASVRPAGDEPKGEA